MQTNFDSQSASTTEVYPNGIETLPALRYSLKPASTEPRSRFLTRYGAVGAGVGAGAVGAGAVGAGCPGCPSGWSDRT